MRVGKSLILSVFSDFLFLFFFFFWIFCQIKNAKPRKNLCLSVDYHMSLETIRTIVVTVKLPHYCIAVKLFLQDWSISLSEVFTTY